MVRKPLHIFTSAHAFLRSRERINIKRVSIPDFNSILDAIYLNQLEAESMFQLIPMIARPCVRSAQDRDDIIVYLM